MRLLVVEDDKSIANVVRQGLESAGYAVDVAGDGASALSLACRADYDLILLDLGLPDMDGLAVLERLRRDEASPPVLVVSARTTVVDRVQGLELGADDYLVKPFALAELLARVRVLLRRGQPVERLQVSDLTLNCVQRKVIRAGVIVQLAPKEFSVLEYLMRNPGRVLSRTMVVEHVWGTDYDGLTNIVDVYIRHLRAKIDDEHSTKLIHTVRGVGYMLSSEAKPMAGKE